MRKGTTFGINENTKENKERDIRAKNTKLKPRGALLHFQGMLLLNLMPEMRCVKHNLPLSFRIWFADSNLCCAS